jgi:DNA primase
MGKVSPPSIKYVIYLDFIAEGVVEKPDIIGAIFGQTEGLLGEDLELREMQKKGKIGRIDVNLEVNDSKTIGKIEVPTSVDKAETTLIGASIETIDRIGPCEAKFEIKSIDDIRTAKREFILDRAKKLMEKFGSSMPELKEMERDLREHTRTAKVIEFGKELLSAGPDLESSSEMIVVEGRADVLSLLKAGIKNAIAMNGAMVPETIKELSRTKEMTLFIDGDRGGMLNAKDAIETARVAFIARAPDGKEVEELTEKEIVTCLRNRMSVQDFKRGYMTQEEPRSRYHSREGSSRGRMTRGRSYGYGRDSRDSRVSRDSESRESSEGTASQNIELSDEVIKKNMKNLQAYLSDLEGTRSAAILVLDGDKMSIAQNVLTSNISRALYKYRNAVGLVIDGTATMTLIKIAEKSSCKLIVAKNFSATSSSIKMISF